MNPAAPVTATVLPLLPDVVIVLESTGSSTVRHPRIQTAILSRIAEREGMTSPDPFGDIPLFREIQRLLSSGGGPVNYEILGQIARSVAVESGFDPAPDPATSRSFAETVHSAETLLAGYTRLSLDEPNLTLTMTRTEWIETATKGWRWLLEPLAERFTGQMSEAGPEGSQGGIEAAMGQIAPLLMGMQGGALIGHLAREVLGRFDLPVTYDDDGKLFLVVANADLVAGEYGFDNETFYRWIALQETARAVVSAGAPWLTRYWRSLLLEVVESLEIDMADLERRMTELQAGGMEAMQEGFGPEGAVPVIPTERHRKALERTNAFLALFEGYAHHAVGQVSEQVIGDTTIIDEGMSRRDLSPSDGETMLASVLGLSLDRKLDAAGETFCAAVVQIEGIASLNRVWDAPDNLPVLAEIKDPFAWMERLGAS